MTVNRYYSSTAVATTLTAGVSDSATTLPVGVTTGFPGSFPYTLILEKDTANEEVVTVTSAAGLNLTVTRGADGTTAVAHALGATVEHGVSARDYREPQEHIAASSGVHGISGAVVGDTDTQTLTGKTLTTPTVNGAALSGTLSGSPTFSGTPVFSGNPNFSGQPTVSDFTNAQHDHSAANKGGNIPQASVTGLTAALAAKEATANKGAASGYAGLDSSARLVMAQMPTVVHGSWTLQGGDQALANNTWTLLTWTDETDTYGFGGGGSGLITVPSGYDGRYDICLQIGFHVNVTSPPSNGMRGAKILKNQSNVDLYGYSNGMVGMTQIPAGANTNTDNHITFQVFAQDVALVAGDVLRVAARQGSGTGEPDVASVYTRLSLRRVGA